MYRCKHIIAAGQVGVGGHCDVLMKSYRYRYGSIDLSIDKLYINKHIHTHVHIYI